MRRVIVIGLLLVVTACTAPENEGGTPLPGVQSGAPLGDEAIDPSEQAGEIEE